MSDRGDRARRRPVGAGGAQPPGEAAIVVRDLVKTFTTTVRRPGLAGALRGLVAPERRPRTVVDHVSFTVPRGELVALLGPNGAGKSTTIKMLTGILVPSSGQVTVAGIVPHRERERNAFNVGAVFGQRTQLWWDLPARQSLTILRDIFEVDPAQHRRRLREFDELLDLSSFWDTPVRHLSLGQRTRCDLAAALLHEPAIVFLDEPTIGMDVVAKEQVREFLRQQVARRGRTVLLTTHDMTEVRRLAERVILINHGRIAFDGPLSELHRRFGDTWQVQATLSESVADPRVAGLRVLSRHGSRVVFGPEPPGEAGVSRDAQAGPPVTTAHEALRRIVEKYELSDVLIEESDVEDVMRLAYLHQHAASPSPTLPEHPSDGLITSAK